MRVIFIPDKLIFHFFFDFLFLINLFHWLLCRSLRGNICEVFVLFLFNLFIFIFFLHVIIFEELAFMPLKLSRLFYYSRHVLIYFFNYIISNFFAPQLYFLITTTIPIRIRWVRWYCFKLFWLISSLANPKAVVEIIL